MTDAGRQPQSKGHRLSPRPGVASKVGFAFSTKDRVEFTRASLASTDACTGFDLVWVDGSDTPEGKALPESAKPRNFRIVEIHHNVRGGPDAAICFGLRRLVQRGYDYCGLIENDIEFKPGWFPKLMELFELGKRDGLEVGAVTARSIESRVLIHRPGYVIKWNVGAGMVLFTREAAQMVLADYGADTASELAHYYCRKFAQDLRNVWEFYMLGPNHLHGCDWRYAKSLYQRGLSSLGTAPSLAFNMDMDVEKVFRTSYVNASPSVTEEDGRRFSYLLNELSRTHGSSRGRRKASMIWYAVVDKFMGNRMHKRRVRQLTHPLNSAKLLLGRFKVRYPDQGA
jgi:hypothetical protein